MLIIAAILVFTLPGCKVSIQPSLKTEDVRICEDADNLVAMVKRISADQNLSFHYGTHSTDYGTQVIFRLIGRGYEIVLFNSMSQSDYTLRVYRERSGEGTDQQAEKAFDRFRAVLAEKTGDDCQ